MRRITAFDRVSADGYFSAADGNLNWAVPDPELDRSAAENIERDTAGTLLFGRRTYQMFESFWPRVLSDAPTAPDPHRPGRGSEEMRAMAVMINAAEKVVFSRTLQAVTWKNSRLVREFEPRVIEELKRQPGKDMMIFGSGTITSLLTRHGLIDEYQFVVSPVLLGSGRSLISGVPDATALELKDVKKTTSGNVMLIYARRA